MSSLFEALRNFKLLKVPPPPPPRQASEQKNGIFLSHRFTEAKQEHGLSFSSQSSSSRFPIKKDEVRKIIGKARLDSQQYGRFTFYLIKWKSKSWQKSTWHHPQHLQNAVGRIMPFNINIKDKPLPYFDPKYMLAEPKYQQILQDFVLKFLQTKRTQKQNSQSIREDQDFDKESEISSRKSIINTKAIKQQTNHERSRDIKIMLTQRYRQTAKKQEQTRRSYKELWNDSNDRNDWRIGNYRSDRYKQQQRQERHDQYIKNEKNERYNRLNLQQKHDKINRKSLWTRDYHHQERKKYEQQKNYSKRKQSNLLQQNMKKIDQIVDKAIRQSFHSKINKSTQTLSNKNLQGQEIQLGEVLDSPQFSKNSDSAQLYDFITPQKVQKIKDFEKQDTQDLIYLSETYKSEQIQIKSQINSLSGESKNSIQFVQIKPVRLQYQAQYQPESGQMILDQQNLHCEHLVQIQQGQLTDVDFMTLKRSLN